jgi:2-isopropylmalate synthase
MATGNYKPQPAKHDSRVFLYDTTLRDGSQRKGISYSLEDKLKITRLLDSLGVPYIEGGWPGSNPKDLEYFQRMRQSPPKNAKIVAFGATRRVGIKVEDDSNLQALLDSYTPAVTLVGKTWALHVEQVLKTNLDENLRMIADSVGYMKQKGKEVIYDAEHFFDAYRDNPEYAISCLKAAHEAGADWLVLCDTNGSSLPEQIAEAVTDASAQVNARYGVHTHNDSELAVANALAGVRAGARQVQGTINGYGERCGNANLISIIPTLQLKMGYNCVAADSLKKLTELSRAVSEIANLNPDTHAAYVGSSAFAHKGGIHVAAVEKIAESYEHIDPSIVGNSRQILVSELSGRSNVRMLAADLGIKVYGQELQLLEQIKELESTGFQFENAEGTVELMLRRKDPSYRVPFKLEHIMVVASDRSGEGMNAEAMIKLTVEDELVHTAAEGSGPVHAMDIAMRKALLPHFPCLADVRLADYKVRILDPDNATNATTRVVIEANCFDETWSTVGCSPNIIEASYQALSDSLELYLLRVKEREQQQQVKREVVA